MCDSCDFFDIDVDVEMSRLETNLYMLKDLREVQPNLPEKEQGFAESLYQNYLTRVSLTNAQWDFVSSLVGRVKGAEPIYGSFNPILVMFRMTQANADPKKRLQKPRIRLITDDNEYFELWFMRDKAKEKNIEIQIGGWQGHGRRRFGGWILDEKIIPYRTDRLTDSIKNTIQSLAMDPVGVSRAMAAKLGVCIYCGSRLSDTISKLMGYGPVCADNYGLTYPR